MQWDKNDKYAVLIGFIFSIILTLCILRNFIFEPGLVESGDIYFPYRFDDEPQYVWNRFLSSTHVPYHQVIFSWLTPLVETGAWLIPFSGISASIETLQRVLWSLFITLISFMSFITVFKYARTVFQRPFPCFAASMLASFLYTVNPYVVGIMQWWPNLLSYAFLPAFFFLVPAAITHPKWNGTLKIGLVAALLLALNFCSPGAALNTVLFLLFLIIIEFFFIVRKDFLRTLLRCSIVFIEMLGLALLLNTYAILPFSLFQEEFKWGGQGIPLQVKGLLGEGGANIKLIDAFRLWKWSETGRFAFTPRPLLTLIVPLIAISTLVLFTVKLVQPQRFSSLKVIEKKTIITLALLIVFSLFLAKGINDPFGDVYIWLVFSTPFSWLFEHSEVWIRYLCLAYTFLCSLLLAQLVNRIQLTSIPKNVRITFFNITKQIPQRLIKRVLWLWKAKLALSLVMLIIFSVAIRTDTIAAYTSSLFLGTADNLLIPSTIPKPYYNVNDWLTMQSGEFRTVWLPIEGSLSWWRTSGPLHHPIGDWASSRPIATTNHPTQKNYMTFTLSYLQHEDTFAKLLGLFNVKYIINHLDVEDSEDEMLYESLKKNSRLTQVYQDNFLYVFENEQYNPYVRAITQPVLAVGNLRVLDLTSMISTFNLSNSAIIFAEQLPGLGMEVLNSISANTTLLFYNSIFTDLLFNSLRSEYIYTPTNYLRNNLQWRVEDRREVMNFEFDYGKGYVYSLEKRSFSFEIEVLQPNSYEVWARVLGTQGFTLRIGEYTNTEISTPLDPNGFTWVKLGETELLEGTHEITLINEKGWGNLNLLAIVPPDELNKTRTKTLDSLLQGKIRIVHFFDNYVLGWTKGYQTNYHEQFTDGDEEAPLWEFYGNWTIRPDNGNKILSQLNDTLQNAWIEVGENYTMGDGFFELDVRLASRNTGPPNPIAITIIREHEDYHSYIVSYTVQNAKITIWKSVEGDLFKLGEAECSIETDQWYTFRLEFEDTQISLYLNNTLYLNTCDNLPPYVYPTGKIYLGTSTAQVDFDNVQIGEVSHKSRTIRVIQDAEYKFAVHTEAKMTDHTPIITVDGINYSLQVDHEADDQEWCYSPPIELAQGDHQVTIFLPYNVIDSQLVYFSLLHPEEALTLDDIFPDRSQNPSIEYERIEAETCRVTINTSTPFILAFSETYHQLWQASTENLEYKHFPLDSQLNGYFINQTGYTPIIIEFLPGRAHALGEAISTATLLLMFISYLFLENCIREKVLKSLKKSKDILKMMRTKKLSVDP
jgi:hypothetical protein